MAKKNKQSLIPSQEEVPAQYRYPQEGACNQTIYTTARPFNDGVYIDTNGDFPQPVPENSYYPGRFMVDSHTDGRTPVKIKTRAPGDGN